MLPVVGAPVPVTVGRAPYLSEPASDCPSAFLVFVSSRAAFTCHTVDILLFFFFLFFRWFLLSARFLIHTRYIYIYTYEVHTYLRFVSRMFYPVTTDTSDWMGQLLCSVEKQPVVPSNGCARCVATLTYNSPHVDSRAMCCLQHKVRRYLLCTWYSIELHIYGKESKG